MRSKERGKREKTCVDCETGARTSAWNRSFTSSFREDACACECGWVSFYLKCTPFGFALVDFDTSMVRVGLDLGLSVPEPAASHLSLLMTELIWQLY